MSGTSPSAKTAPASAPETRRTSWPACATWLSPPSVQTGGPTSPPGSAGHPATTPTRCHYSTSLRENAGPVPDTRHRHRHEADEAKEVQPAGNEPGFLAQAAAGVGIGVTC